MFSRKSKQEEASPPPPPPKDESETREVTGLVIRQEICRSGSSMYNHIAVFVAGANGEKDMIVQDRRSCEYNDAALCQKGDRVSIKMYRHRPDADWRFNSLTILYDIEKERASAEAAARPTLAGED